MVENLLSGTVTETYCVSRPQGCQIARERCLTLWISPDPVAPMRIRLLIIALLLGLAGTLRAAGPPEISTVVAIQADGLTGRQDGLAKTITSVTAQAMKGNGVA